MDLKMYLFPPKKLFQKLM